ncbi:nicotinate-nucleotide adenylyltransferase [Amphibacillus xylanus]|uniref:Probable nicotinate-nucleotide adenylyltransferase n=1 Tax=Amphibacillus xylanus (strain ATCC 51415 / DSM 6626 / JCM 7361 / LMG 17667 / NBRC 15112 / Ep01) TaxID=698758 RepID=K0J3R2_AMPXN|nr:nicotinate-nucleotide adenylyltransferase [Amphibacillus xylanus]BAM47216.1 nicotinate-nucleotide adenylyltransferase [Amphibacillus xylanus NBRC 15112]
MKKIGLLGGTFDPPHIGHLTMAEEAYEKLNLDEVWFIPSAEPPHKEQAKVSAVDRLLMLKVALEPVNYFKINTIELERQGKSYTYDTIQALKEQYPTYQFYFIIGADMVEYLPNWYKIDQLIELVQFVGVKRPDYQLDTSYPVIILDTPGLDISSTMIRERLKLNRSVRYLIPERVLSLIKEKGLYGQGTSS